MPRQNDEMTEQTRSELDLIGDEILEQDGPAVKWVEERIHNRTVRICYFARSEHVEQIMRDDDNFDLSNYDDVLEAAAGDVRFLLGVETPDRDAKHEMIEQVIGSKGSKLYRAHTRKITSHTRECADQVLDALGRRDNGEHEFNVVREYAFLVPYLVAERFVGVSGPANASLLVRLFTLARNLTVRQSKIKLTPDFVPYHSVLVWSHLILGHVFANFQNKRLPITWVAKIASRQFKNRLDLVAATSSQGSDTLVSRFIEQKACFSDSTRKNFDVNLRSVLFEFTGAMVILVGISFCNILEEMLKQEYDVTQFAGLTKQKQNEQIDHFLRLNSTTGTLYRRVTTPVSVANEKLLPDEYAGLFVGHACRDHRTTKNLTFGPENGPHECFGEFWARSILCEMFAAFSKLPGLKLAGLSNQDMVTFLNLQDHLAYRFYAGKDTDAEN